MREELMYLYTYAQSKISPTMTSLLSQRRQFGLNCKKIIALKIAYKIVAFFTENYPSCVREVRVQGKSTHTE